MAVQGARFGVAGLVRAGRTEITNLSWVVDERQLAAALNLDRVTVINDLRQIRDPCLV